MKTKPAPVEMEWRAPDGARLWLRQWRTAGRTKGAILLIHGIGEHTARYDHVAGFLNEAGYAVHSFDLRGHGRSQGRRGHIKSYDAVMDDIQGQLDTLRESYPGVPVFLYGHSLGGNIAMSFVLTRKPAVDGLIASSPGITTAAPVAPAKLALARLLYRLVPAFTLPNGLPKGGLSRDPEVQKRFDADPLCHDRVSARLGLDLIEAGERIRAYTGVFPVPLLLMQGSADTLVNPAAPAALVNGLTGDVTLKTWNGMYHELHNEPEWPKVLGVVLSWIEKRRTPRERPKKPTRPAGPGSRKASVAKPRRGR